MTAARTITVLRPSSLAPHRIKSAASASKPAAPAMRAVNATGYGPTSVLTLVEVPRPTPKTGEVLIRIHATNVTAADSMMRRGTPAFARLFLGLRRPKKPIPGTAFSGTITAVGSGVTKFQEGNAVFGETGVNFGAHAEYLCLPEEGVILPKPLTLSFEDAALMSDGPLTSLNFLNRLAQVKKGQKVLINGASGSLGTAAVQIARAMGAEVTAVCGPTNREMVKGLGADRVIDYTREDFTSRFGYYDAIYDTVGKSSYRKCKQALKPRGCYLSPVLSMSLLVSLIWTRLFSKKTALFDATGMRPIPELINGLLELCHMVETQKLHLVTELSYPFHQIPQAHQHVDRGHKKGNLVIPIIPTSTGPSLQSPLS